MLAGLVPTLLRSAAARTREALEAVLLPTLGAISRHDAAGFFAICGYVYVPPEH